MHARTAALSGSAGGAGIRGAAGGTTTQSRFCWCSTGLCPAIGAADHVQQALGSQQLVVYLSLWPRARWRCAGGPETHQVLGQAAKDSVAWSSGVRRPPNCEPVSLF